MIDRSEVGQRGYLNEDFRLFHLKDRELPRLAYHYHDFNKMILFLSGNASYVIEGKTYLLKPGDILLVSRGMIHKPVIEGGEPYERIVIWLHPDFLGSYEQDGGNLGTCFALAQARNFFLLREDKETQLRCRTLASGMEAAISGGEFGSKLMARTMMLQLLVAVNRSMIKDNTENDAVRFDQKIEEVMVYINQNIEEDLSVDTLSKRFYMSRSYLMHRFRDVTGTTAHKYITEKRLLHAMSLLRQGDGVMKACQNSGFGDYSAFSRAFKAAFGESPRAAVRRMKLNEEKK